MENQQAEQQQAEQQPQPILTLQLSVPEVNQVIAGLENLTKPLVQKIVQQAQAQLNSNT